jgi:DNA-directed RNA polymerase specialized sigma24 family protein
MREETDIGGRVSRFPTTRRSAVLAAGSEDHAERERGFELLVAAYWKPVYKYIRVKWRADNEQGKDLTQSFFARAFEKDFLRSYEPRKGSFRNFLRICLDGHAANERKAARRQKRDPGSPLLPLDFAAADGELAAHGMPAGQSLEDYFHAEAVRSLFALSVEALRAECAASGKELAFEFFEHYDLDPGPSGEPSYAALAAEHGLSASQVTSQLAYARRTFRRLVLDRLRAITGSDREFREEARAILGRTPRDGSDG